MVSRAEPRKQKTRRPERTGIAGAVSPRKRRKKKREECTKSGRMSEEGNETGAGSRAAEMRCGVPTSESRGRQGLKVASCLGPATTLPKSFARAGERWKRGRKKGSAKSNVRQSEANPSERQTTRPVGNQGRASGAELLARWKAG